MTYQVEAATKSYIHVTEDSDFSIQNLPLGIFRPTADQAPRVGVALGEHVIDLAVLAQANLIQISQAVCQQNTLNALLELGVDTCRQLRQQLVAVLRDDESVGVQARAIVEKSLHDRHAVMMCVPVEIGDYTDFYSSEQHAFNVGSMFRGKGEEMMPNWKHMPIGYHGRSSSMITTDMPVYRPQGQILDMETNQPIFSPSKRLDFELEMGFFVGKDSEQGKPVGIKDAQGHIVGMVIVNDWSARDIQKWEYQPLGPFLGKSFATSISPWLVMLDALEPFRVDSPKQDPMPLDYLQHATRSDSYDIHLAVSLCSEKMLESQVICQSNHQYLYWTMFQQVAHHTIGGCNLNVGDMMASGTISGSDRSQFGSMLEISWAGKTPLVLTSGEQRKFLEDGDTVAMSAYCQGKGYRVGFGEVKNQILPNPHY